MKKLPPKVVLLSILLTTLPCAAEADDGWYGSLELGHATFSGINMERGLFDSVPQASPTESGAIYRLAAGYQFNTYFGIEGGYANLGQDKAELVTPGSCFGVKENDCGTEVLSSGIRAHGYLLEGTGTMPLQETWALYVRAGIFFSHVDAYYSEALDKQTGVQSFDNPVNFNNHEIPTYGLGVEWACTKQVSLSLGVDFYNGLGDLGNGVAIFTGTGQYNEKVLALGLAYSF